MPEPFSECLISVGEAIISMFGDSKQATKKENSINHQLRIDVDLVLTEYIHTFA